MKIRVVLMTENNMPVSALGDNPEEIARRGWETFCALQNMKSEDRVTLEKIEIIGD